MERARRHQRGLARLALLILALVAELGGRSLAERLDFGRHVETPYSGAQYYPILLAVVKVAVALMLARVAWRFVKARAVARAARRLLAANGSSFDHPARPRVRFELSARLWLGSFLATSSIYLLQIDGEGISSGRWPLLAPWLHTAALPVFAVLSVVVALVYRAVENWLSDYERYARDTAAHASGLLGVSLPLPHPTGGELVTPRSLFGLAFEVRPPPVTA
jgi:hypothetical protein